MLKNNKPSNTHRTFSCLVTLFHARGVRAAHTAPLAHQQRGCENAHTLSFVITSPQLLWYKTLPGRRKVKLSLFSSLEPVVPRRNVERKPNCSQRGGRKPHHARTVRPCPAPSLPPPRTHPSHPLPITHTHTLSLSYTHAQHQ